MSVVTIGALERGLRRAPYRDTIALLAEALDLGDEARASLSAAAVRQPRPRREPGDPALGASASGAALPPHNLPLALTNFVGRESELSELRALLASARLTTIAGTGGIGKTRIALQLAAEALEASGDEVWFAELGGLSDAGLVAGAVVAAAGVAEQPERPVLEALVRQLGARRVLLVLDNCEHVIGEAARVAETLLLACPGVRLMATSREPLRVAGERVYRLPPLAVPPQRAALAAADALQYAAVRLFADRAVAADANFRVRDESAPAIGEICRRLDGIALAIELAAARVNVLAPQRLAEKLDERFRVLTGGSRSALPRQQTMWALIDWSYDLLSDAERRLFRRLSVFAGGWTPEAAGDVCGEGDDVSRADEVLGLLWNLVDKSLVAVEPGDEYERYRLLESTREYAQRRLQESGEADALARRHAAWCLAFGERAKSSLETMPELDWFAAVDLELDNVRGALDWSLGRRNAVDLGATLSAALGEYWPIRQPHEGRSRLEAARAAIDSAREPALAAALTLALVGVMPLGTERRELAACAVAGYRGANDTRALARALRLYGNALIFAGALEPGAAALQEGLELARTLDDERRIVAALDSLGTARRLSGDLDGARALLQEALERSGGDAEASRGQAHFLTNFAELEFARGDVERALALAQQAREAFRRLGNVTEAALMGSNLAAYSLALDRFEAASAFAREALAEMRGQSEPFGMVVALEHLAVIAGLSGEPQRAAALLGFTDARLRELDLARQPTERHGYQRLRAALTAHFGDAALARRLAEGAALSEKRALELAVGDA